jgi:hypothetical protein
VLSPRPRAAALGAATLLVLLGASCTSDEDHPELAVQRTETGSFVIHLADCDEPQLDEVRVIEVWGEQQEEAARFDRSQLDAIDPELGPTAVAFVQRYTWPPRLRIEVDGGESFDVMLDPDDVPPVDWQLLVPDAPKGDEVVDLEDFAARCD